MATRRELASSLTQAGLLRVLSYDLETGVLRWVYRVEPGFRRAGKAAGRAHRTGYVTIKLNGEEHAAHRLIWLMMTGSWPEHDVDHIDGDRSNNRWDNLRAATRRQNAVNAKVRGNNTSGVTGVSYSRTQGIWIASIKAEGGRNVFKQFEDKEAAISWRREQEAIWYGEFRPRYAA